MLRCKMIFCDVITSVRKEYRKVVETQGQKEEQEIED